jgi:hypothetical protein
MNAGMMDDKPNADVMETSAIRETGQPQSRDREDTIAIRLKSLYLSRLPGRIPSLRQRRGKSQTLRFRRNPKLL